MLTPCPVDTGMSSWPEGYNQRTFRSKSAHAFDQQYKTYPVDRFSEPRLGLKEQKIENKNYFTKYY